MATKRLEKKDLESAYKKLKKYAYYSNDYFLISKLSEYDLNFESNLNNLFNKIQAKKFRNLEADLASMSFYNLPKKIPISNKEDDSPRGQPKIITNFTLQADQLNIEKTIKSIDVSIDIQILCLLWIIRYGYKLVEDLSYNYGNMLFSKKIIQNLDDDRLFKVYWYKYQNWRNEAIEAMNKLSKDSKNGIMVMLDIKEFYGSVRIDKKTFFSALGYEEEKQVDSLTNFIYEVYSGYSQLYLGGKDNLDNKFLLPIGLPSSAVIANWYLKKLDQSIVSKCNPYYYGRYVDDIICVFHSNNVKNIRGFNDILDNYLNGVLENTCHESIDELKIKEYDDLCIQKEKIMSIILNKEYPSSILDKFKHEIDKQSSEFRFLPDLESLENTFNITTGRIHYEDSINKLRSIKEFSNDKFGLSSFLSKAIYIKIKWGVSYPKVSVDILKFFTDWKNILDYYQLWVKVFIYFISINDLKSLNIILGNMYKSIDGVTCSENNSIQLHMRNYIKHALTYAWSFRLGSSPDESGEIDQINWDPKELNLDILQEGCRRFLNSEAAKVRKAKLFNHKYYPVSVLYDIETRDRFNDLRSVTYGCFSSLNEGNKDDRMLQRML